MMPLNIREIIGLKGHPCFLKESETQRLISGSEIAGKHLDREYGNVLVALGLALSSLHFSPASRRASM
jgi:hypothetical protein